MNYLFRTCSTRVLFLCALFAIMLSAFACAPRYALKPTSANPEDLEGVSVETLVTPKCVVQAGTEAAEPNELTVRVRVINKSKKSFEFDPTSFVLKGPKEVLKSSPQSAREPGAYVKELLAAAELEDSRTKMESYQGVEELATLRGENKDKAIDAANSDYKRKQEEAKKARESAVGLRKRAEVLKNGLKRSTLTAGDSVTGFLIFKVDFKEDGPVTLESTLPPCEGQMNFILKR